MKERQVRNSTVYNKVLIKGGRGKYKRWLRMDMCPEVAPSGHGCLDEKWSLKVDSYLWQKIKETFAKWT